MYMGRITRMPAAMVAAGHDAVEWHGPAPKERC